jgi:hypothetical protein
LVDFFERGGDVKEEEDEKQEDATAREDPRKRA